MLFEKETKYWFLVVFVLLVIIGFLLTPGTLVSYFEVAQIALAWAVRQFAPILILIRL